MFEKYTDASLNEAGGGGEYEVVVGFGWSNGVLIWVADTFRDRLQTPPCAGDQNITSSSSSLAATRRRGSRPGEEEEEGEIARRRKMMKTKGRSAIQLDPWDARWTGRWVGGLA